MIELSQHIDALLLENDCVIVPGFGGFIAHYTSALYQKNENLFLPPTRTFGFSPQLTINDGVLVQSYMSVHNTNFPDATRLVENDVNEWINLLNNEGKIRLDNIGEITYNIHGNYEFTPIDNKLTTPSLYGLDSFEMRELATIQSKEKVLIPNVTPAEKKTYEIRINRAALRNVAAIAAVIVLFFAFSTPVKNTNVQNNNYAQLLPDELFEQIRTQSIAMTPLAVVDKSDDAQSKPKTVSKPVAVREVKVKKQPVVSTTTTASVSSSTVSTMPAKTATIAPVSQSVKDHPYHIIVLSGVNLKDAQKRVEQLKNSGFTDAKVLNNGEMIRVSVGSYDNRNEANKQLLQLRNEDTFADAWLLVK